MPRPACVYGVVWGTQESSGSLGVGLSPLGAIQVMMCNAQGDVLDVCLSDTDLQKLRTLLRRAVLGQRQSLAWHAVTEVQPPPCP